MSYERSPFPFRGYLMLLGIATEDLQIRTVCSMTIGTRFAEGGSVHCWLSWEDSNLAKG
jgi:hypothetical protein